MDMHEVIKARRSIRKYKTNLVPMAVIKRVLDAARIAPTWANLQGIRYVVIKDKDQVAKVVEAIGQKWCSNAPMFIAAISDAGWSGNNGDMQYYMLDVGIAFEHLILAATAEGLGTCWIGFFDEERVKEILEVEGTLRVVALTPIGYPDEAPAARTRKKLGEIAFLDKYGKILE